MGTVDPIGEIVSGHVGGFAVFAYEDLLIVGRGRTVVQRRNVPGLKKFLTEHQARIRLTLGQTEDFTILGLWGPDGYGYALNLEAPELSEWGYGGER